MGWSATKAACDVMDRLEAYCRTQSKQSNTWTYKETEYFWELGCEHKDGHISMVIWRIQNLLGNVSCMKCGSIYINPDGSIRRMPKYLQEAIS